MKTDRLIIGAGLYGLYAALYCAKQGYSVVVIECENAPFKRATYINQARVHLGYHYPRSYSTAKKSANYFDKFFYSFIKVFAIIKSCKAVMSRTVHLLPKCPLFFSIITNTDKGS